MEAGITKGSLHGEQSEMMGQLSRPRRSRRRQERQSSRRSWTDLIGAESGSRLRRQTCSQESICCGGSWQGLVRPGVSHKPGSSWRVKGAALDMPSREEDDSEPTRFCAYHDEIVASPAALARGPRGRWGEGGPGEARRGPAGRASICTWPRRSTASFWGQAIRKVVMWLPCVGSRSGRWEVGGGRWWEVHVSAKRRRCTLARVVAKPHGKIY